MKESLTVWDRLRDYAAIQPGPFTSQEVLSWFHRHAPSQASDQTVRTHIRGACWNVVNRSQFSKKEPFLTRLDRGLFRRATSDEIADWRSGHSSEVRTQQPPLRTTPPADEWHTEANIQSMLVTALATDGWRILSVANTASKERGVDVIASRHGQTVGIEVKGYPSRAYADPSRAGEKKRTAPSTQAGHWYAQAVLAAMRLRGKEPSWRSVIALPDFPRYRNVHSETTGSLDAAGIEVWWVDRTGALHRP
ncbi:hypothetical protein [Kribbella sp. NPDC051770]|uniref:DUF7669 domain-containing protein n=1 Tax=Kribbella sp. NPDC051770 TaxID=3155413 RepID=UPI00343CA86D